MPDCCACGGRNRTTDGKKFFSIPRGYDNISRRKIWLHRIGRKDFVPTENTRLCENSVVTSRKVAAAFDTLQIYVMSLPDLMSQPTTNVNSIRDVHGPRFRGLARPGPDVCRRRASPAPLCIEDKLPRPSPGIPKAQLGPTWPDSMNEPIKHMPTEI
ncbi:hypothetical protein MRX96_040511 [Rhipicephalus microplus]